MKFAWHLGTEGYANALQITAWSVNRNDFPSLVTPVGYIAVSEFPFATPCPFFLLWFNWAYLFSSQGQSRKISHHWYPIGSAWKKGDQCSRGKATQVSCFSTPPPGDFQSSPAQLPLQKSCTPRLHCRVQIPKKNSYAQELERQTGKWGVPVFILPGSLFGLCYFCL